MTGYKIDAGGNKIIVIEMTEVEFWDNYESWKHKDLEYGIGAKLKRIADALRTKD